MSNLPARNDNPTAAHTTFKVSRPTPVLIVASGIADLHRNSWTESELLVSIDGSGGKHEVRGRARKEDQDGIQSTESSMMLMAEPRVEYSIRAQEGHVDGEAVRAIISADTINEGLIGKGSGAQRFFLTFHPDREIEIYAEAHPSVFLNRKGEGVGEARVFLNDSEKGGGPYSNGQPGMISFWETLPANKLSELSGFLTGSNGARPRDFWVRVWERKRASP